MSPPIRDPRAGQDAPAVPHVIALVGLRGSGKSTVGALLATELRREFVDLDREIERLHAGVRAEPPAGDAPGAPAAPRALSVGEILQREGEHAFRELESRALDAVLARGQGLVLACGGGVVVRETNRRRLRAQTWVLWLQAPVAELAQRLQADATLRPSLTGAGTLEELGALALEREPWYREIAHVALRTEGLAPAQVARLLAQSLPNPGLEGGPLPRP